MNNYSQPFAAVKQASRKLIRVSIDQVEDVLERLAELLKEKTWFLLEENQKDLDRMDPENPMYDRLALTEDRILGIAQEIHNVQKLPSPLHIRLEEKILSNGLYLEKISVPLGVIGVIYEARPNVTLDVFSLALKSGNGLILKGGSDAEFSNKAIIQLIYQVLREFDLPQQAFLLLPSDRQATSALLEAVDFVDVIIPRGSQGLIDFVRQTAKVPVIETGAGIVHAYVDESADLEKAKAIILNSKTRRPSVCNSLDCLIIHQSHLPNLEQMLSPLLKAGVEVFADSDSFAALNPNPKISIASENHFGSEFLSLKLSIKTVKNIDQALEHISKYSSKHSEAIIAEKQETIDRFLLEVDAAAVYANASTAFTDGAQFGLGAEIGISTQKLHARGPMGLRELTSYKWVVRGNGQVRN
ncbi:glutamate-5-semialdehyde dehydrogenase [Algoriphagus sp.]|uniref:glutamate-5-semialdehyde dehydrogenase n=1 Tax=Algoriphagus sp. TaxID=1872435 RepID=UPI00260338A4|nr:glutamate-5-semialdehyde dehydrogenase [Algoriphagus sp.]